MICLSALKTLRTAMTQGEWDKTNDISIVDVRALDASGKMRKIVAVCNIRRDDDATDEEHANATGIVATHNAADVLVAVTDAALTWMAAREEVRATDVIIEGSACVMRLLQAEAELVAALAKVTP